MQLISILACSNNGIIGINNDQKNQYRIPWKIRSDMKHFKTITTNNVLIMGSKTYESLPKVFFNNDSREIIILTRNKYMVSHKKNIFIAHSKDHALKIAYNLTHDTQKEVIICGGKEIYALFMLDINKWIVSHINVCITLDHRLGDHDKLINIDHILTHIQNNNLYTSQLNSHMQNQNDEYDFKIIEYLF